MNSNSIKIKKITESIISLPTLPTVVSKMIQLVDNPKTSASSLARLIYTDQALTARILKLANSAYYGFPREISTVNMAIVVLGFNTVKEMGLSLSVFEFFKDGNSDTVFDIPRFWEHSIGCGSASRMLARRLNYHLSGEAFVAGLLHDIGKIILRQYLPKEFLSIIGAVSQKKADLDEAEMAIVGVSHAQIGSWLAEKWNLPRIIVDAIAFHHSPGDAKEDHVLVAIVSVANYLCHLSQIGNSGRLDPKKPDDKTWDIFRNASLELDESDLGGLQNEFLMEFDKTDIMLNSMRDEHSPENLYQT
jgi:putative nucleotidyltransferase with HDIG domain